MYCGTFKKTYVEVTKHYYGTYDLFGNCLENYWNFIEDFRKFIGNLWDIGVTLAFIKFLE